MYSGARVMAGRDGSSAFVKINTAKRKLLRGEPAFGYELGLGSPLVAEVMGLTGIDFLLLDTQHGSWGPESTILGTATMCAGTSTPMARAGFNNFTMIGRLLDEGMLGIVVPMVDTAEQAGTAAAACRYPPKGRRSWGWARARAYGADYVEWIDEEVFLAVQIESARAVENAEAILATPGVDGCWVGPGDLALSLGFHPREAAQRDEHARALERVLEACRNTGKVPGIWTGSPEAALARARQGFRFLTAGSDSSLLSGAAQSGVRKLAGGEG